ncbi:MAG: DNA-processing protein DprA [Tissierellia bacterium]|jgi:DNA processing protein|nr:DNA-processing protein DprA [Tissierellia bacterium]
MEYWIWLTLLKGIGTLISKRLLNEFGTPGNIYNASYEQLTKVPGIGSVTANMLLNNKSLEAAKTILDNCCKNRIRIITCDAPIYENISSSYLEMPILLYYKGEIKNKSGIAIVGSRRCSSYGKRVVVEAAEYLAKNDIVVISGMAKGIDGYAHTACLNAGGYTIAFLGNGLDICYPKEHSLLMNSIIENGAVISEYPPEVKAKPEYFPRRNFLISSWCEKILVVEASKNSGALITAAIAKKQGKKVIAVPSDIYSTTGEGTNQLIYNGSEIYLSPKQLIIQELIPDSISINKDDENKIAIGLNNNRHFSELELTMLSYLSNGDKTIDEISELMNKKPFELIECLSMLEIENVIKILPNGRILRGQN